MARLFKKVGAWQGVAAGQTATLDLPVGDRVYDMLHLEYATTVAGGPTQAQMEADLTEFRLKVDGKTQRRFSAADLFKLNAFNGQAVNAGGPAANGFLPIWFAEFNRRTPQGEDLLGWGTADIRTLQLEIDIAAGATAPAFPEPSAEIEKRRAPMAAIVKWRKFTIPVSGTGPVQFFPPLIDAYYRLHLIEQAAGDINSAKLVVDGEDWFDATDDKIEPIYTTYGFTPQAGVFHLILDRTQRVSDVLPMVRNGRRVSEFRLEMDMAVANAPTLITEVWGPRD